MLLVIKYELYYDNKYTSYVRKEYRLFHAN